MRPGCSAPEGEKERNTPVRGTVSDQQYSSSLSITRYGQSA